MSKTLEIESSLKMSVHLEISKKLAVSSRRVKCLDFHQTEPWLLASLNNGEVQIWNYEIEELVKSFKVCSEPVRAGVFVPLENWIVTGTDDTLIRVFNCCTFEQETYFKAHSDYIRSIVVHPTQPFILSASDDKLIKLWNWSQAWVCERIYEGHAFYVMQIAINPKDNNMFASASLDRTIKVWQIDSATANFTLEGHENYINTVDFHNGGDKPYLISGDDDHLLKLWDYKNQKCIRTLEGHVDDITAVRFHTELPILITGSLDGIVHLWHSETYELESSLDYGLKGVWSVATSRGSNKIALGYDEGTIVATIELKEPTRSSSSLGFIYCGLRVFFKLISIIISSLIKKLQTFKIFY